MWVLIFKCECVCIYTYNLETKLYLHITFQLKNWFSKCKSSLGIHKDLNVKLLNDRPDRCSCLIALLMCRKQEKPVSFSAYFVDSAPAVNCTPLTIPQVHMPQRWLDRFQSFCAGLLVQGDWLYGANLTIHVLKITYK